MSTLNKFIIFECDTCKRQTEIVIDSKRVDPIRCNITLKCRGKLSRIGDRAGKTFLFTPPVSGLQDYVPRGTVTSNAPKVAVDPNISLNSGPGVLSMAILRRTVTTPGNHQYSVLDVNSSEIIVDQHPDSTKLAQDVKILLNLFSISPSVLQSINYVYLKSGVVQVISGPDDSPSSNTLRFTADNKINVLINGIELLSTEYTISVPDQSITLTPAVYESNNVINVVVYNDLTANVDLSKLINLEFNVIDPYVYVFNPSDPRISSNVAFLESTAWGNNDAVQLPFGERYIMHCTDLTALNPDVTYGVKGVQVFSGLAPSVGAGSFMIGATYIITSEGNSLSITNFILIGATGNSIGTVFTATGVGEGTGTATQVIDINPSEVNLLVAKDPYTFRDKELNAFLNGSVFDPTFSFIFGQDQLTGVYKLTALQSKFNQLLQSLIPTEEISSTVFSAQSTQGTSSATSTIKNKYIIGPT